MTRQIKVGLFILAGLLVAGVLIFIIGEQRHLFSRTAQLIVTFRDVVGLAPGSPVRMGGVDIGQIDAITFSDNPSDNRLRVELTIVAAELPRVRRDSVARIASKGLLGDKTLEITIGSPSSPRVPDGSTLRGEEAQDIGETIRSASQAIERANDVMANVRAATQPLSNPQFGADIVALVHDLHGITHQVADGPGSAHTLLTDDSVARHLDATLAAAQNAAQSAAGALGDIQSVTRDVRTGHGFVHALVYDPQGESTLRAVNTLATELGGITHDVRTGPGGLHQVIYGNEAAQAIANINQTSADLRDIVRDVRAGHGTVGALLVDPSLYEDLKSLVGNLSRNEILRAMVRYSIHRDEAPRPVPAAH